MLLKCQYGFYQCSTVDFYKDQLSLLNNYATCYTINKGKNLYGDFKEIPKARYDQLVLDLFLGDSDLIENSEMGLVVFVHEQKYLPFYESFRVSTGKNCLNIYFTIFLHI